MIDPIVAALLKDMRDEANSAMRVVRGRTDAEIVADPDLSRSLAHSLMLIGEAANQTPAEFRLSHPELAWNEARGMRNRIVHGYRTVVPEFLIDTARRDLPSLIDQIDRILVEGDQKA